MSDPVPVFDGHNDTIMKLEIAERIGHPVRFDPDRDPGDQAVPKTEAEWQRRLDIDLPRARRSGFAGGLFAMYTPSRLRHLGVTLGRSDPRNTAPVAQGEALSWTLSLLARMRRMARALPEDLAICTSVAEIRGAFATGRIAMVPHVEGAECIDTDLDALEVLHAAGLRSLGPVWSRPNAFGFGAPMHEGPDHWPMAGLTSQGKALVRECETLGIMVDLSHLNEGGFWDVARISSKPLVASHSNVHAFSPTPRNLTDRQMEAVAESRGLVGLNFNAAFLRADMADDPEVPLTTMIRHLDRMLEILGEEGVALGSDFDGCLLPREIGDVTGLPRLVAAMRQAGYGEELIAKICRENWLRVLEETAG